MNRHMEHNPFCIFKRIQNGFAQIKEKNTVESIDVNRMIKLVIVKQGVSVKVYSQKFT
jgi:hypothetical protein